jgi:predicted nucleic acid-binding protein
MAHNAQIRVHLYAAADPVGVQPSPAGRDRRAGRIASGPGKRGGDFIDAYNAAWLLDKGIRTAYTFDRKHFARFEGMTVKAPGES